MKSSNLIIKVVTNHEEMLKASLIRAIVYMHEQNCPYNEEFDLNDFTSTQIIGLLDGEPILTARIRYISDFAKLERLAIRPQFRGRGYGHDLIQFMLDFVYKKGIGKCYLHAQKRLQKLYESFGFAVIGIQFSFSDYEYVEMFKEFKKNESTFKIGDSPHVVNRPEGQWHKEGPIEKSFVRVEDSNISYLGRN